MRLKPLTVDLMGEHRHHLTAVITGSTRRNFSNEGKNTVKICAILVFYCIISVSFCHWTLIESQRKTVVSVTGAAAPRQDITGIYDVLNVSFVPPCGSSLWQLGKAAACNELIIPPSPLSVSSSNTIVVQNYLTDLCFLR